MSAEWTAEALCARNWDVETTVRGVVKRGRVHAAYDVGAAPDWFPDAADGPAATLAKALCRLCPVAAECLQLAVTAEAGQPERTRAGIYAGTSPAERAAWDTPDRRSTAWPEATERREAILRRHAAGECTERIATNLAMTRAAVYATLRRAGIKPNPRERTVGTARGRWTA